MDEKFIPTTFFDGKFNIVVIHGRKFIRRDDDFNVWRLGGSGGGDSTSVEGYDGYFSKDGGFSELHTDLSRFIADMKRYTTTNSNVHVGNLYEHSVWSTLYAEDFTTDLPDIEERRFIALAAFMHDVGKMTEELVYYSIPDHPRIGRDYVLGYKNLPYSNINLRDRVLRPMGLSTHDIQRLAFIVDNHKILGDVAMQKTRDPHVNGVNSFASRLKGTPSTSADIYALLVVSLSDALATMDVYSKDVNRRSIYIPFLSNRPGNHIGGRGSWSEEYRTAVKLANEIKDAIHLN